MNKFHLPARNLYILAVLLPVIYSLSKYILPPDLHWVALVFLLGAEFSILTLWLTGMVQWVLYVITYKPETSKE